MASYGFSIPSNFLPRHERGARDVAAVTLGDAVKMFGKITKQIGSDATKGEGNNKTEQDYPNPGTKVGTVVNFGSSNSRKINDSMWVPTTEQATDTSPVYKAGFKF